jgi:hypothetical protein
MRSAVALIALVCCRSSDDGAPPPPPAPAPPAASTTASGPRRTYFVAHEGRRCVLFWMEHERHSVSKEVTCPRDLLAGERARLSGKTCLRESSASDRNVPIRCPREVLDADRHDRAGKGRWKLDPAE